MKFKAYGVIFENVMVSGFQLPKEIEKSFAETTKYDIKLQNQNKKNENDVLMIENE